MQSNNIFISIVMPTYNSEEYILKTLECISSQSYKNWELTISDDGSADNTAKIINSFIHANPELRVTLLQNAHRGPGMARNQGVLAATSEWISFLDSDDRWTPDKLERVVHYILEHPSCNLFCHSEMCIQSDGSKTMLEYFKSYDDRMPLRKQVYNRLLFSTSAIVCRKELIIKAGLFDEGLKACQDYDLWYKMVPWMNPCFIKEQLGFYIERPNNITSRKWRRIVPVVRVFFRHRKLGRPFEWLPLCAKIVARPIFNEVAKIAKIYD